LVEKDIHPNRVAVIGDNQKSEIQVAHTSGMTTIQMAKNGQIKSDFSNFIIN